MHFGERERELSQQWSYQRFVSSIGKLKEAVWVYQLSINTRILIIPAVEGLVKNDTRGPYIR